MVTTRLTRDERKAQTRADLLAAARRVFLRRGFHGASLDEIAEEAGYTKGAVYSNFADKDALFVALLDERYEGRVAAYSEMMLEVDSLDEAFRRVSWFMVMADQEEPDWLPTLAQFVAHASQHEELMRAYARSRERFLNAIAGIIETLVERYGVSLRVSSYEAARWSSVLIRGYSAERRIDAEAVTPDLFVELQTAFMHGLTLPRGEEP